MNRLLELAELVNDEFFSDVNSEGFGGREVCENKYGFEVSEFYPQNVDPSYLISKAQKRFCAKLEQQAFKDFCREFNLDESDELSKEGEEDYYDFEREIFQPALLSFEVWKSDNGNVVMEVTLNYRDAPYYRVMYADTLVNIEVSIGEFESKAASYWLVAIKQQFDEAIEE